MPKPITRQLPDPSTLVELRDHIASSRTGARVEEVPVDSVTFRLTGVDRPVIEFRGWEDGVPAGKHGVQAFGAYLGVPSKFLSRLSLRAQQVVLSELIQQVPGDEQPALRLTFTEDGGIQEVVDADREVIDPLRVVAVALQVLGREAVLTRLVNEPAVLAFDAAVPETWDQGVGGEQADILRPDADLATGGLRFHLDRKRNLAPSVARYLYRRPGGGLGFEVANAALKVDARNKDADWVISELLAVARAAFTDVEDSIEALYDLKGQPVPNPERVVAAVCAERGIKARPAAGLVAMCASERMPEEGASMFDVATLFAYAGNLAVQDGSRLIMEQAAGSLVDDHAERCGRCKKKAEV